MLKKGARYLGRTTIALCKWEPSMRCFEPDVKEYVVWVTIMGLPLHMRDEKKKLFAESVMLVGGVLAFDRVMKMETNLRWVRLKV